MAEEKAQLRRYHIQLDGNRGQTVMKLRPEDLENYNVIGPVDGEEDTAEEEQAAPAPATKKRAAANKSRSAESNK